MFRSHAQPRAARVAVACVVALAVALLLPPGAAAHGLVGKQDLPIPRWLFAWGAAAVLVISFAALATLWPKPVLQEERPGKRALVAPRWADPLCGLLGFALFAIVVYSGLAGTQTATANLAPTVIYVAFWVGLPILSLVAGDVFRAFNPWRAVARAVAWVANRVAGSGTLPEPLPYPQRLGRWPAVIGIFGFAWVELAYSNRDDPSTLALLALAYAAVQLVGMSLYGIEPWTRCGDAFSVYFNLFSRLSPVHWRGSTLEFRRPLAGVPHLSHAPGTVALLCTMIGTTSFDGFSQGPAWTSLAPDLQRFFNDLGFSLETALEMAFTVGLIGAVLVIASLYWLGVLGMHTVGSGRATRDLAQRFAHTLVPIALAYVIAHYFSLLAYQGQALAYLASDPLGHGSDLFGTASATIDYGVVTANGVWYVQVGSLVLGHVAGLMLAHDRALALYSRITDATRSQYWMLAVMVAFTSLGLWLLSASL